MKKHLQVVGAVVVREGKVLAARRGESRYPYVAHKYEFVGGKVEAGETEEEALLRELREELRVQARVLAPFASVTHEYPDFVVTLHTYRCEFLSDSAIPSTKRSYGCRLLRSIRRRGRPPTHPSSKNCGMRPPPKNCAMLAVMAAKPAKRHVCIVLCVT